MKNIYLREVIKYTDLYDPLARGVILNPTIFKQKNKRKTLLRFSDDYFKLCFFCYFLTIIICMCGDVSSVVFFPLLIFLFAFLIHTKFMCGCMHVMYVYAYVSVL